jgi:hypothetical protein
VNQEPYILMYEKSTSQNLDILDPVSLPLHAQASFRIFESYPPNYYVDSPTSIPPCSPRVCRTKEGKKGLVYTHCQTNKPKLKAYEDQLSPTHLKLKGYTSSDLLSLLPGSWLTNFLLNNYMWLLEKKRQSAC